MHFILIQIKSNMITLNWTVLLVARKIKTWKSDIASKNLLWLLGNCFK